MKAKFILPLIFTVASSLNILGQGSVDCEAAFKAFEQKITEGNYNGLSVQLADILKDCPKFSEKVYIYGVRVLKANITSENNPELKSQYVSDLVSLYDLYEKNFPVNNFAAGMRKAMLLKNNGLATEEEAFKLLDASFARNKEAFTDYEALQEYFILFQKRYEQGNKQITDAQFVEKYGEVAGQVMKAKEEVVAERERIAAKQQNKEQLTPDEKFYIMDTEFSADALDGVLDNISLLADKHFNCQKLEAYYGEKLEANNKNISWLESMVNVMYNNKCYNAPSLYKAALSLHKVKPSSKSAERLANIELKLGNTEKAIAYFDESAEMEESAIKKSNIYLRVATIVRNIDKAKTKQYITKAADLNPKSGQPYLMLAEMYSSVTPGECKLTEFERKALLWLAIDTLKKAEMAEPKYKSTVEAMGKSYGKRLPTKAEAKEAKKDKGDKIAYGCWINETVTVPKL
jgi:hypothetical protein